MNQYIIVGTLGQGAFGKVKLVLNSTDMNLYAVKLLSKGSLMRHQRMRPRTASDFQVEAQRRLNVIRLLHHPNIICPVEVIGTPFDALVVATCAISMHVPPCRLYLGILSGPAALVLSFLLEQSVCR